MKSATAILKFLQFSAKLKLQERSIKLSKTRQESPAEHSWQLALMAMVVAPHLRQKVNLFKALKMIVIHDLVEATVGDLPHGYAMRDKVKKQAKQRQEKQEIVKIRKLLGGSLGKEVYALWQEFEAKRTREAKFVKALDSLEANHQSILYDVSFWENWYYEMALHKADEKCVHEPILRELNAEITRRMRQKIIKAGFGKHLKEDKETVTKYHGLH